MRKPLRTINIKSNFFGLTMDDLLFLMIFYSLLHLVFSFFEMEIFSILLTFLLALILIPIRLKMRRGIIKDYFKFFIHKLLIGNFYE